MKMQRYFMIAEDSEIFTSNKITEDDKHGCDCGVLDVIDTKTMKQYYEGEWHPIKEWGE